MGQKMAKLPFERLQEKTVLLIVELICFGLSLSATNKWN